jgi:hypothetical protein
MADITTTTTLSDTIETVLESARFTAKHKAIMANLAWKIDRTANKNPQARVPYWGTVTAQALTEGVDLANPQAMSDTLVTVTPAEVGAQILLTDKVVRDNSEDVKRAAGRILGDAMELKRDQDLLGQLDDGADTLGGASTATLGHIAAAYAILAGVPAPKPYACVMHPYVLLDLVDVFTPILPATNSYSGSVGAVGDEVLRNYMVGKLFGVPIYEEGNIDTTTCKGGMFSVGEGGALILATAKDWAVEPERDASLRATELNIVGEYGVGEYLADWIVELHHDATTPA